MLDQPYLGYASESDYHEHHTLLAMLEGDLPPGEREELVERVAEIEATSRPSVCCFASASNAGAAQ